MFTNLHTLFKIGTTGTRKIQKQTAMSLDRHVFNLKLAVKQLTRNGRKCSREETSEKELCKKAIQRGNHDIARMHAENAIRNHHMANNLMRLSSRVDGVVGRVQSSVMMYQITSSLAGVVQAMDAAMRHNDLDKVCALTEKFEKSCQEMDIHSSVLEETTAQTHTSIIPREEVDALLYQMAEEEGLSMRLRLPRSVECNLSASTKSDDLGDMNSKLHDKGT